MKLTKINPPKVSDIVPTDTDMTSRRGSKYGAGKDIDQVKSALAVQVYAMQLGAQCNNKDPEDMWNCFTQYMKFCAELGQPITNSTAYLSMGISNDTANKYMNSIRRQSDPRFREVVARVKAVCASTRETLMAQGTMSPIAGIWFGKNFDGLSDNPQQPLTDETDPLGELESIDAIKARYSSSLIDDSDYAELGQKSADTEVNDNDMDNLSVDEDL